MINILDLASEDTSHGTNYSEPNEANMKSKHSDYLSTTPQHYYTTTKTQQDNEQESTIDISITLTKQMQFTKPAIKLEIYHYIIVPMIKEVTDRNWPLHTQHIRQCKARQQNLQVIHNNQKYKRDDNNHTRK